MSVTAISIIVDDARVAAASVAEQFGWARGESDFTEFADVHAPGLDLWFSTSAAVSQGSVDGLTIHVEVDDVDAASAAAVERGAELLLGPLTQDFGMRSAVFRGPGGMLVDLCRAVGS